MNGDQVQRELGNLDARVTSAEAFQNTTERKLEKILERLRTVETRVAIIVALALIASKMYDKFFQ